MAFQIGKIRAFTVADANRPARIFADPAKLSQFISGLTSDSAADEELTTVNVSSHRVRRYPGDPGYIRPSTTRQRSNLYMKDGAPTTPGKPFFCEVVTGSGPTKEVRVTRFTYTGSWITLRRYIEENLVRSFTLRRESGKSIDFVVAPPSGG